MEQMSRAHDLSNVIPSLTVKGQTLKRVRTFKLLGTWLNENLNRDRGEGGAGRAIALPLFCWHIFSRAPVDMENVLVELLDFCLKGGR